MIKQEAIFQRNNRMHKSKSVTISHYKIIRDMQVDAVSYPKMYI